MWCFLSFSTSFCSNFSSCSGCPLCSLIPYLPLIPADQIQKREQKYPNDVDKMPIQPEVLDIGHVSCCLRPGFRSCEHESKNRDADDHVQCVHAGHGEIQEEVHLGPRANLGPRGFLRGKNILHS